MIVGHDKYVLESKTGGNVREIPHSDHDAILQLWTAMIGTNGHGLVSRFEKVEESIPQFVTKKQCDKIRDKRSDNAKAVFGYIKDLALISISILAFLHGQGVL